MIKHLIFDYDGVFTKDDYSAVIDAFHQSSGILKDEIEEIIGIHERKHILSVSSKQFLNDLKKEFNYPGSVDEIANLLNHRGDSGLYDKFHKLVQWKNEKKERGLSILSNQLVYRIHYVRKELEDKIGLENFDRVWFSPECGYQKPFVGVTENSKSHMDISKVNIFPMVAHQLNGLGYKLTECIFIDDSKKNVNGWVAEGGKGIIFENVDQMFEELGKQKIKI